MRATSKHLQIQGRSAKRIFILQMPRNIVSLFKRFGRQVFQNRTSSSCKPLCTSHTDKTMNIIKCNFLIGLHNITIDNKIDLKNGIELTKGFFMTNNKSIISELVTKDFIPVMGLNEYENIHTLSLVVYRRGGIPEEEFDERKDLIAFLKFNALLCQALWLIKDNAVLIELGHLIYVNNRLKTLHSNYLNVMYSNHLGESTTEEYTLDELQKIPEILTFLLSISEGKANQNYTNIINEYNRIERAFIFIQSARATYDVGVKVGQYCTAFECLFSVSNTELKHRLSETIGFLLGVDQASKRKIYNDMQKAYDLRSSVVHGDTISSKYSKQEYQLLKETAKNCDNYLREIFNKFFVDKNLFEIYAHKSNEELQSHILDMIFKDNLMASA